MNFNEEIKKIAEENNLKFITSKMLSRYFDKKENNVNRLVNYYKLKSIKNGVYAIGNPSQYEIAFELNKKSYISLDSALYYHKLIPEIVRRIMSVTTLQAKTYENVFGVFKYKNIKEELFFDYEFDKDFGYRIATKEKAINDYFYFSKIRVTQNIIDSIDNEKYETKGVTKILEYFQSERFQNLEVINFKKLIRNAKKMNKKNYYLCKCLEYYYTSEYYDDYK